MRIRLLTTVATPLFALFAHAQQLPSPYPYPPSQSSEGLGLQQNPYSSSLGCSDPAMAGSPQCAQNGVGYSGMNMQYPGLSGLDNLSGQAGRVATYSDEYGRPRYSQTPAPVRLPPEPLTEFQKFVASSTGDVLPIYGASLFQNVPSTFAPLDNAPVPPDYVLGPDDGLRIRVWGQVNFNADVRVDRSGDVYLPQIGQVHVAGLRFSELQQHIHDAVARVYRNFQLQVDIGQIRSIQIYVTGEARRAGVYTVSSLATLIDALFASGGPSVQGSMRHIDLRRNGQVITTLDLYSLLVRGDKSKDAKLLSGDVIHIPPVGQQVGLIGSVRRPAIYELTQGETLDHVLQEAGGVTALASQARASLERTVAHSGRTAMEIRLDAEGRATVLEDGDVVHVLSIVSKFDKTVTLRGNTANPGRFAWHDGMHLSDLIPDRESLLTRDYWWKRGQLGLTAPEFESLPALTNLRQPASAMDVAQATQLQQQQEAASRPASMSASATGQTVSASGQNYPAALLAGQSENNNYAANSTDPNAPQKPAAAKGNQSALAEQDEDRNDTLTPQPAHKTVVRVNVPEIDWSYAVIERVDPKTLKTQLVPFDLGKLVIEHDQSQDLALQPGDVVTVFSQSDIHVPIAEQTTLIRLEGEFAHAGTYSVLPGETLRQVVERAGGLSPNAYLYGSVFTRESTRVLQQRRLDESVRELTLQMQRGNLALASSPMTTAQDLAGVNAAQASEQALVAQLQQVRANGRIVFQFKPESQGANEIPDIKLENGDKFLIPSVPSTVNVLGAVFNQNSFIYRNTEDVKAFLMLAGGPNSNADKKRMFIVRANGSVVSKTTTSSAWNNNFMKLRLNPGDSIIVPEKVIKPSALRGILDWTQLASQLGLTVAVIHSVIQ